jgi:glucokinase
VDGKVTDPGVPAGGRAHHLLVDGVELEEVMSRRAIRRAYQARIGTQATADNAADVLLISTRAREGDAVARAVLRNALQGLGVALGPALVRFGAEVVVVGGSMAGSWDLFEPWFLAGAAQACAGATLPTIRLSADAEHAALIGAATVALGG